MQTNKTIDGNEAAVNFAYQTSEVITIYPIMPGRRLETWRTSGVGRAQKPLAHGAW